jgi:hypothetical protein
MERTMPPSQPMPDNPTPHTFYFGPFRFDSEMDIPELRASAGTGERLVSLRLGGVPATIANSTPYGSQCHVSTTEYLLDIPGTARYYVTHGNQVRVDFAPGTPLTDITTYLLGSVFGVLCHQNGLLPLHASAVEHAGEVTAFLGDSGAGKSTLAACLQRRGHTIVSDDICLLESTATDLRVIPVAGWLKLWNQSLQFLGESPDEQHRVFSTDDKYRLFLADAASPQLRLARIVFLSRDPDPDLAAQPTLQPLDGPDAMAALMDTVYAPYVPALTGQRARTFRQCARAIQQAHVFRLTAPWGLDRLDAVLDRLEHEIRKPATTA